MSEKDNDEKKWTKSIELPKTKFAMKANLAQKEPKTIEFWKNNKIYANTVKKRKEENATPFILHDGPPYANGNFHVGHALNKILKDIIIKYQTLNGKYAPYVPGWDCHGLPIELAVIKKLANKKNKSDKDPTIVRKACRDYALDFIKIQGNDQTRFGVFWDDSDLKDLTSNTQTDKLYYTMNPSYEAGILESFRDIFKKGHITKGKKPIHWCASCATALAEAEVEYDNHTSPSVYVKFPVANRENTSVVIWTTTPWTIPANLGVSFHPDFQYCLYETEKGKLIIAEGMEETFFKEVGLTFSSKEEITLADIESLDVRHPFIERESKVLLGEHVTLEAGTGIVHTAPGHGHDDYIIGLKYGLEAYSPVDHRGRYTSDFPLMEGKNIFQMNPEIVEMMKEKGILLEYKEIEHSYPHCWRCHKPLIFRSTPQWFLSVDGLREKAKSETQKVEWVPDWGQKRFESMVENRPDWCISRQRLWGVPIPAISCNKCNETILTEDTLDSIIEHVKAEGIEVWFDKDVSELIPKETTCPKCGGKEFTKERDILDVWFDSGVSWASVLKKNKQLSYPADMYLEGSDQHRGWFQSSLWPSLAIEGQAPYKKVLTHGYVLDAKGRAMSKSRGNVISPVKEVIPKYGADILRLWVSSEDYRTDNTIGFDMLDQLSDSYRKIRNTFRYILGNLKDGSAIKNLSEDDITQPIDKWALHELAVLERKLKNAYEDLELHKIYHEILNFCTVTLSNEYFDIIRDSLYCDSTPVEEGRSVKETKYAIHRNSSLMVLQIILKNLVVYLAPILSFTTEEIFQVLRTEDSKIISIFQEEWKSLDKYIDEELGEQFNKVWDIKKEIYVQIEEARKKQIVGSSTEVDVKLPKSKLTSLENFTESNLAKFFVVSNLIFVDDEKLEVAKSTYDKCPRCWLHKPLSTNGLCERCSDVVE